MRQLDGKRCELNLIFEIDCEFVSNILEAFRPAESSVLKSILEDYRWQTEQITEKCELFLGYPGVDDVGLSEDLIDSIKIDSSQKWWKLKIYNSSVRYPPRPGDLEYLLCQYVALFSFYQSACERTEGGKDRFREYFKKLVDACMFINIYDPSVPIWTNQAEPSVHPAEVLQDLDAGFAAIEGEIEFRMSRHRKREAALRARKIEQVEQLTGRLRCEVPGCGFDFHEVYGDRGRGFIEVHHKAPLADRVEPSLTRLEDLAVVCANCHAMIHRGGGVVPLNELIPAE